MNVGIKILKTYRFRHTKTLLFDAYRTLYTRKDLNFLYKIVMNFLKDDTDHLIPVTLHPVLANVGEPRP